MTDVNEYVLDREDREAVEDYMDYLDGLGHWPGVIRRKLKMAEEQGSSGSWNRYPEDSYDSSCSVAEGVPSIKTVATTTSAGISTT